MNDSNRTGTIMYLDRSQKVERLELPVFVAVAQNIFDSLKGRERTEAESLAYDEAMACIAAFLHSGPVWLISTDGSVPKNAPDDWQDRTTDIPVDEVAAAYDAVESLASRLGNGEIDEAFCQNCNRDTQQKFVDAGHERDSSGNRQECLTCGWWRLGAGPFQPPIQIHDPKGGD